ncbi:hypothetical protein GCM10010497_27040 [Streptomyces cinereoruber]|uniref:Uncharacterized protein n=1 Tax=Streptomyces cinereoruber TaxID=67260 RepID=A0AAV4KHZ5_9ACTN|nr:hypothetical protein GCM10010497_27040 [Streptomyces cinereoruber]
MPISRAQVSLSSCSSDRWGFTRSGWGIHNCGSSTVRTVMGTDLLLSSARRGVRTTMRAACQGEGGARRARA